MLDPEMLAAYNRTRRTRNDAIFCHAAFTNMNFEQNGNATVCCYNRTHVLGTYPRHALEEMWFGDKAEALRGFMKANLLPDGCGLCAMQFESRNFGGLRARAYDTLADRTYREKRAKLTSMPKMMEFEISNVCNLECTMCNGFFSSSIRRNREELPPLVSPYDYVFVRQLETFIPFLVEAKFLGGEPFLINRYYEIWDLTIRLNPKIRISITTNGTVLNNRVRDVLEKINAHIIMSIDSLEKESYERIRKGADFGSVMENLQWFRDYTVERKTSLTVALCPMQQNWREIPAVLDFCNERGAYLYFNTVTHPPDHALNTLSRESIAEVVQYLSAKRLDAQNKVHDYNNANYRDLIHQVRYFQRLG